MLPACLALHRHLAADRLALLLLLLLVQRAMGPCQLR
jgi:hypothetical protein